MKMPSKKELQDEIVDLRKLVYTHVEKANTELGEVRTDVAEVKTNIAWLQKTYWLIASASVGSFISVLLGVLWSSLR